MREDASSLRDRNSQWLKCHNGEGRTRGRLILIAEDSEADIFFLFRILAQAGIANPVHVVRDGTSAMNYLQGAGLYSDRQIHPLPGIVLLDLKMPGVDPFEILRWTRDQAALQGTLMVAVSSYDGVYGINLAYESGADTFLGKPLSAEDALNLISAFEEYLEFSHATRPGENQG